MASTAQQIIDDALRQISVISQNDSPTATMSANALRALNMLISSWGADNLMTRAQVRESFSVAASAASYSIGVGQTLDAVKPFSIESAFTRDSEGIDIPLEIITREEFDSLPNKDVEGVPYKLFYDPGLTQQSTQIGTIYLYPETQAARTLFTESEQGLVEISALGDTLTFEAPYEMAFKYNLAIALAPEYQTAVSPAIAKLAKDSLDTLITLNATIPRAELDLPTPRHYRRGGRADVRQGF